MPQVGAFAGGCKFWACKNWHLHSVGRSQHGVLGLGAVLGTDVSRFRAVVGLPAPSRVHRVSAGAQHCAVLVRSSNGQFRVYGCGDAPFLEENDVKIGQIGGQSSNGNEEGAKRGEH